MSDPFLFDDDQVLLPVEEKRFRQTDDMRDLSEAVGAPAAGAGAYYAEPAQPAPTPAAPVPALSDFPAFSMPTETSTKGMLVPLAGAVALAVAGGWYAGPWGAATGAAASGAIVNLGRFAIGRDKSHLVFGVVAAALAAYTGNEAYKSKATKMAANPLEAPWLKRT